MQTIKRDDLKQKLDSNDEIMLVEVLGPDQYEQYHLPGAINVPVSDAFEEEIQRAVPDKSRAVVVYCANEQCDASPKAAQRMEQLGYQQVYDYEAGKVDWKQAGLPIES